jgi:FG-GAP-like repeat/Tetratricopeptide repeat
MKYLKLIIVITVLAVIFLNNCSSGHINGLDAEGVSANNRGAALMGQFKFDEARQVFEELEQRFPHNLDIKINHAIAIFNRQLDGDEQSALKILNAVLQKQPDNLRARYCSGLLELHSGKPDLALKQFLAVLQADADDGDAMYFSGKTLMQLTRYDEALAYFNRAIASDQYMRSAYYAKIMALRQMGKTDDAFKVIAQFQKLRTNPRARLVEFKYTKMGRKAEIKTIDSADLKHTVKPDGPLFTQVKTLSDQTGISWRKYQPGQLIRPGLTICDMNNDSYPDLFFNGAVEADGLVRNVLLLGTREEGKFLPNTAHPLAQVPDVNTALWGDLNDDGIADVYLCRRGPNQLWQKSADGKWQEVTHTTQTENLHFNTVDGALYDADHDGDLDIFLVNSDAPNELLNNNRDGTFRPLASEYHLKGTHYASRSVVISDLDGDRDADIIVINQKPPHDIYINQLLWKYTPAKGFDTFISSDIQALVAGDIDTDGRNELYSLDSSGSLFQWEPNQTGTWEKKILNQSKQINQTHDLQLAISDVDGDGHLDLISSSSQGWSAASITESSIKQLFQSNDSNIKTSPIAFWKVLHSSKGPQVIGWSPGLPPFSWGAGFGRYPFVSLQLTGMKDNDTNWRSNASGIGTSLAARVDSNWTVLNTFRAGSGPGQSLQPVIIGLGGAQRIDFIALDWSDGVYQSEMNLEAGKLHRITETQRQLSSCPVIFAWNGEKYEFVSDFLGVGGIGYAVSPGQYSQPRPWENFMLPDGAMKSKDGKLIFKLTEPMEEVAYIDAAGLKTYDLPPGWFMTLDERMGILGLAPTGKPRFYRQFMLPSIVMNNRREDVTGTLDTRDLKAAPVGELDLRFIGRLKQDNVLTLTFPKAMDSFEGEPILIADGWVEYPYSQTNFAAWQAGADYRAPTIEVLNQAGQWVTVLDQFGYPAGMPRQMSVPLRNLPAGVRKIRITTNQEIYWDRIAIAFSEPCPQAEMTDLKLSYARLEQIGFPQRQHLPQRLPYYDYDNRVPYWDTRFLEGNYTRFGLVDELLLSKDNAVAIFGAGEGIHLEFNEPTNQVKEGWTRIYVIETHGWCKDMDFYTLTGETIEPVPYQGKRGPRVKKLHKKYNTRYLSGRQ